MSLHKAVIAIAAIPLLFAVGCASQGRRVSTEVEAVMTHDFNPTDLQIIADQSVEKMLKQIDSRGIFPKDSQPFLYVAKVRNFTNEHIDTQMISERIAVKVQEASNVQLVDRSSAREEALNELQLQQGGTIDPDTAKRLGKQIGAEYVLVGSLSNLVSSAGGRKGQYFQFTLTLTRVETNQVWKVLVDIQKVSKRGWFGW